MCLRTLRRRIEKVLPYPSLFGKSDGWETCTAPVGRDSPWGHWYKNELPLGGHFCSMSPSNVPAHVASGNRKAQRCFCLSGAKGKNREPGSHKISVRKFMSDRKCIHVSPWGQKFRFLSTSNVPAYVAPGNRKSVVMFAASANRELGSRASCATAQDDL